MTMLDENGKRIDPGKPRDIPQSDEKKTETDKGE
jgi:hypothetical protein